MNNIAPTVCEIQSPSTATFSEKTAEDLFAHRGLKFTCKESKNKESFIRLYGIIDDLRFVFTRYHAGRCSLAVGFMDDAGELTRYEKQKNLWDKGLAESLAKISQPESEAGQEESNWVSFYFSNITPDKPVYANGVNDVPHEKTWNKTIRAMTASPAEKRDFSSVEAMMKTLFTAYVGDNPRLDKRGV